VRYVPGELRVIAYKKGTKWAEKIVRTTGEPAKLELEADRIQLRCDGRDLAFITVKIVDQANRIVPGAKNQVNLEINGPAEIVATDNGDATNFEKFDSNTRRAFHGLVLVVVRTQARTPGTITLRANSKALIAAQIEIKSL
jgi:beta-galactosidase